MKAKLITTALVGLALSTAAFAQTTTSQPTQNVSTSSVANTWQALKDGPMSASFSLDSSTSTTSDTTYDNAALLSIGYKLSDVDSFSMLNIFEANYDADAAADEESVAKEWDRVHLKWTRKGLMTEKENGMNLALTVEGRYRPDTDYRNNANRYGLGRVGLKASKSVGDFSFLVYPRVASYFRKDSSVQTSLKNYLYLVLNESYSLTEKTSLSFTQEIFRANRVNGEEPIHDITLTAEVGRPIVDGVSGTLYLQATPVSNTDETWETREEWTKELTIGLNIGLSIF